MSFLKVTTDNKKNLDSVVSLVLMVKNKQQTKLKEPKRKPKQTNKQTHKKPAKKNDQTVLDVLQLMKPNF